MFVIEKFKSDFDSRQEAWEKARDKYVGENEYVSERDYADRYTSPRKKVKNTVNLITLVLVIVVGAGLMIGFAQQVNEKNKNKPQEEVAVEVKPEDSVKNCKKFNLNDFVVVQYGYYQNQSGTIVGGCEKEEQYQVKLSESKGDAVLSVNSGDNLVVVALPQEEKEE
jgi:hypothetical protein